MEAAKIKAQPRKVLGKKVKHLRNEGILPANVFGSGVDKDSIPVQLDAVTFEKFNRTVGESDLIYMEIDGEKEPRPVLMSEIELDPIQGNATHVSFYQVDLTEKVQVMVPLSFVGESPAVKNKVGIFFTLLNELEVESLPTKIPHELEVDISSLTEVGDIVTVEQINVPEGVELLVENEEEVLAKIQAEVEMKIEEEEEDTEGLDLLAEEGEEGELAEGEETDTAEEEEN